MLKLRGKVEVLNPTSQNPSMLSITRMADLPSSMRARHALLVKSEDLYKEASQGRPFAATLLCVDNDKVEQALAKYGGTSDVYLLAQDYDYLADGDIIRLSPYEKSLSSLFRKNAPNNSILLTERCNHLCLMCSQPPKKVNDSWLMDEAFDLVRMIPVDTPNIGFTGGEPTIYGERFIELVEATKRALPSTSVDVLTNGRSFKNEAYAAKLGRVRHPNLQLGIPLYSDDPVRHDYIVQAQGAFDETIQGILNLKRHGVKVEIRVVVHQQSLPRLVETCEFIARNLVFVDHVALMGLEITGYTRANLDILWADQYDYRDKLSEAIEVLRSYGMHSSVYNHQLCLVNSDVEDVYRKSISDWKNEYLDSCSGCLRKSECGGFFSTQVMYKHSRHITPFVAN
jgi:His-Xaa-Ser system radical SAM maturase HxsC